MSSMPGSDKGLVLVLAIIVPSCVADNAIDKWYDNKAEELQARKIEAISNNTCELNEVIWQLSTDQAIRTNAAGHKIRVE